MVDSITLRQAADLADEIAEKQRKLNQLLAGHSEITSPVTGTLVSPGGRHYSAEARAKISEAQKRRWRAVHKSKILAQAAVASAASTPLLGRSKMAA